VATVLLYREEFLAVVVEYVELWANTTTPLTIMFCCITLTVDCVWSMAAVHALGDAEGSK
jgi:hypothetical protein